VTAATGIHGRLYEYIPHSQLPGGLGVVTDEQVLDAVSAEAGWMEDLLVRLVEVPTTLGDEEGGLHGSLPKLVATTATTDARHFVRSGSPAVCFGLRAEGIHGIDERVSLRSMVAAAQVLALFICAWCNRGEER
jgi:hypothetical protein